MNPQGGVDLVQSPKLAAGVAAVGGVSGLGAIFGVIPIILGIIVSALTATMLVVLIRMHWINSKKIAMEYKQLKEEAKRRKKEGLPCRRCTDHIDGD